MALKFFPITLLLSLFSLMNSSCSKSSCDSTGLPACIEAIIQNQQNNPTLQSIQSQIIQKKTHYWLQTGALSYDGPEYIVNNSCDTVCFFCGKCQMPQCALVYSKDWKIIWKK